MKQRAGIQSLEVGFALFGTLDRAWGGAVDAPLRAAAAQLSRDLGHLA
jgi:hypothetical protein